MCVAWRQIAKREAVALLLAAITCSARAPVILPVCVCVGVSQGDQIVEFLAFHIIPTAAATAAGVKGSPKASIQLELAPHTPLLFLFLLPLPHPLSLLLCSHKLHVPVADNLTAVISCGIRNFSCHTNDATNANANATNTHTQTSPPPLPPLPHSTLSHCNPAETHN